MRHQKECIWVLCSRIWST